MSLRTRLSLWLGGFFLIFWIVASVLIYSYFRTQVEQQSYEICLQTVNQIDSVQRYVREVLRPMMFEVVGEEDFIPEAMSTTYVARNVIERFLEQYPDYYIKFATTNPRNPVNLADETEQQIIDEFEANPELEEWRGTIERDSQPYLSVATPLRFGASCMQCHGDPADAPPSLRARYGETNGFRRQEGEVAIKSVNVPVARALATARTRSLSFASFAGMFLVALFLLASYLLEYFVARPIQALHQGAKRIGEGRLDHKLEIEREDEIGELASAFNQMTVRFQGMILQIRDTANNLSSAAAEILAATTQQASGASEQSAAVNQTTATMEHLATTSRLIAEAADQVVSTAARTQSNAQDGVSAVTRTVQQMEDIRYGNETSLQEITALGQRSQRIGDVMQLINNIADQTRLLAFNAAIEAEAAGEAGRRFGVVATEVRRLANSVTESTGEIRERITETQIATNALIVASEWRAKQIEEGFELTRVTARALEEILESAREATLVAEQISLSIQQQRTAAEQEARALREVREGVKQVATGSQQMTEVGKGLLELADKLQAAVEQFKLEEK